MREFSPVVDQRAGLRRDVVGVSAALSANTNGKPC